MISAEQAAAKRAAAVAKRDAEMQQAKEQAHSEARQAYKAECRANYPGDDTTFNSTVWPALRDAWEKDPARSALEATKQDLLSRHLYHGF